MQARDEAPDLLRVEVAERSLFLQREQDVDGTGVIRKRVPGQPALMLERLEPGLAQVGIVHRIYEARAASAPAVSSPMRRR